MSQATLPPPVDAPPEDGRDFTPVEQKEEVKFEYPGIPVTCDGAEAVVHVETNIAQGTGAYPITSSTTMGGGFNAAVQNGKTNLWGDPLIFMEPESEHSSASFCEGFALAGGRVTNFTSGQGLVLMKEVLYTIAGKRLPVVFHIGARALTSHSLNVHAGHDDLMSVADVGWGMLFSRNAQEAGDLALICRRAAEASQTPFFNVQDGFLTTHTVETVRLPEPQFMKEFIGPPSDKLVNLMDPSSPMMSGVVQNQDSYMKGKIAQRWYYDRVGPALEEAFDEFARKTGRRYDYLVPYRCEDAEYILIGMGGYMETTEVTVDYLREEKGIKAGCVTLYCFRPFPMHQIVGALKNAKAITVFERMDDPLSSTGNHLTREIKAAFCDAMNGQMQHERIDRMPRIYHGAAGLGSRDVRPADVIAAFDNMKSDGQDYFCVGIKHALSIWTAHRRPRPASLRRAFRCGGTPWAGSAPSPPTRLSPPSAARSSARTCRPIPNTGRKRRDSRPPITSRSPTPTSSLTANWSTWTWLMLNDTTALFSGNPLKGMVDGGAIFMQSPLHRSGRRLAADP